MISIVSIAQSALLDLALFLYLTDRSRAKGVIKFLIARLRAALFDFCLAFVSNGSVAGESTIKFFKGS